MLLFGWHGVHLACKMDVFCTVLGAAPYVERNGYKNLDQSPSMQRPKSASVYAVFFYLFIAISSCFCPFL